MPNKIGKYFNFDLDNPDFTCYFLVSGRSNGKKHNITEFISDKKKKPIPVNAEQEERKDG